LSHSDGGRKGFYTHTHTRYLRNTGEIIVEYINTTQNLVDLFIKGLARDVIDKASREVLLKST
jgi:hypothetical protein